MRVYCVHLDFTHRCGCKERQEAQREGRFFYATAHAGYVFPDKEGVPRRRDGRPYVWVTCPFCGNDLDVGGEG